MGTRMTSRIPVTPATHTELKQAVDESADADTYDALLQQWLTEFGGGSDQN